MGKVAVDDRDAGFTMVEMMIALMVLAIVMTALAPAFLGELKASAAASYRSTANGLAVGAIEDMRAFPFYQIGYNQADYSTTGSTALTCVSPSNTYQTGGTAPSWNSGAALEPVQLPSGSALDNVNNNLPTTQTISGISFTTTRCVYWMPSSTGSSAAYKLTWVGVSWSVAGVPWHVSQTSAIYPGGEGKYSTGHNYDYPGASNCVNQGTVPGAPMSLTAAQDGTSATDTIDLTWSENSTDPSSVLPVQYQVNYSTTSSGPWIPFSETGLPNQNVDGLAPGTPYYFQVSAVACDGTPGPAAVTSEATANAAQSCTATGFTVTPTSATINSQDKLTGNTSINFSVNVTSACNNIYVSYSPKINGTYTTDYAPAGSGTLSWTASAAQWAVGTVSFSLYVGGSPTGTAQNVKITCNGKSC